MDMKLRYKLTLMIIGLLIGSIAITSGMALLRARDLQKKSAYEIMENLTGRHANDIADYQWYQEDAQIIADLMGRGDDIEPAMRRSIYLILLRQVLETKNDLLEIYAVFTPQAMEGRNIEFAGQPGVAPDGSFIPYYSRESGNIKLTGHENYTALLADLPRQNTVDEPMFRMVNGRSVYSVSFRSPIKNRKGEVIGCVGLTADLSYTQEVVNGINPYGVGAAALYSHGGMVVASRHSETVGTHFRDNAVAETLGPEGLNIIEEALETGKPANFNYKNAMIQVYPLFIGDSPKPWLVALSIPVKTIMAQVNNVTRFVIISSIISVILSTGIVGLIVTKVANPIANVAGTLKDISEGEGDLTKQITINSKDEIGDLAHYFNLTLEKIKNLVIIIKTQTTTLFDIGNELSTNMTQTAAAVNEITANIQSIKGQVINQSASITETNATMERITVNLDKLNEQIDHQTSSVSQSSAAIEQMLANIQSVTKTLAGNMENVSKLAEASEVGRAGLQEVAADIQEIARESEGLLEINTVIQNIASQTNLLSMNAAVEAAHAGEAGKGFAVVADEIRKLAENAGHQSKTISAVLKKIKDSIDKITPSTNEVLNKFGAIDAEVKIVSTQVANIKTAMEDQNTGSRQILEVIEELNNITRMVKSGSTEMLEGSNGVIQESKHLEAVAQEIASGMNEMAAGANEINIAVDRVNEISGANREHINVLVQEVSRFKVE
jgi:methyl-accepting chemotaxis protein